MGLKDMLERIDKMQLDNKIILFVFLILGIFGGLVYIGVLIVPNWEVFLTYPWVHQFVSYSVIVLVFIDISFVIILTLKTAINNHVLLKLNTDLTAENIARDKRIIELEKELIRLKKDD